LDRGPVSEISYQEHDTSRTVFRNAWDIAREIGNAKVVLHADAIVNADYILQLVGDTATIIVTSTPTKFSSPGNDRISIFEIPSSGIRRPPPVQFSLLFLLSKRVIEPDDIVVHVYGIPDSGYLDSIRLSFVKNELDIPFPFADTKLSSVTGAHVLTRVLQIATELAREGREGKPVGALFVVGDYERVRLYTHQLIINPFRGYKEEERNILDPSLEETVKEYAKIDGAFIIREDGVIISSGAFISGSPSAEPLQSGESSHPLSTTLAPGEQGTERSHTSSSTPHRKERSPGVPPVEALQSGLGARHAAGLSLSASTSAFSVVLSESTRKITVYHAGKAVVVL
jgi:hypothetical protein